MVIEDLRKTEKFILELTYDEEKCDIAGIIQRIINSAMVGVGIREIVSETKLYDYSNGREVIGRSNQII